MRNTSSAVTAPKVLIENKRSHTIAKKVEGQEEWVVPNYFAEPS
jgi:hypothetical protein